MMMRKKRCGAALMGFLLLGVPGITPTQAQNDQQTALVLAPPAQNAGFSELQWLLERIILQYQPEAKTDVREDDNLLILHYTRVPKFQSHITGNDGNLSRAPVANFGPNFDEFLIYVRKEQDALANMPVAPAEEAPQTFGITFSARYNLQDAAKTDGQDVELRYGSWPYKAMQKLTEEKLADFPVCNGTCLSMSRYEFMIATVHLLRAIQQAQKFKDQPEPAFPQGPKPPAEPRLTARQFVEVAEKPENRKLIDALRAEFAPELIKLTKLPKDELVRLGYLTKDTEITGNRYEYLSLRFSYGKGVNPEMVSKIKATVAGYAKAFLKSAQPTKGQ